ncbi:putative RNA-binding protein 19 [Tubulanus polymorphus]|uniref:putative RNA-binding protein 19 n=1 Tax=Tubulanus polymorphus TaxID=672921 RepID=UPI003DA2F91D
MSRIIVKNLPKDVKDEKIRSIFSAKGTITDLSLKYTKQGVFRKFCFIGYSNEDEARNAMKCFNNSFIDTSKLQVELCSDFNNPNKPRAWSKHSKGSSAYERFMKTKEKKTAEELKLERKKLKKEKKLKKLEEREEKFGSLLGTLKDDPEFKEFLEVHKNRSTKTAWGDDVATVSQNETKTKPKQTADDDSSDEEEDDDSNSDENEEEDNSGETKTIDEVPAIVKDDKTKSVAMKKGISDLDYLKSKKKTNVILNESSSSSESDSSDDEDEDSKNKNDEKNSSLQSKEEGKIAAEEKPKFVIKMRELPLTIKEGQIRDFFKPLNVLAVRIARNAAKRVIGVAYVDFVTEKEQDQAARRNKNFLDGKKVHVKKMLSGTPEEEEELLVEDEPRPWEIKAQQKQMEEQDKEMESIGETGRLYLRNLAYDACTEEILEETFSKYGPVTDIHLPIDKFTKKIKGFAFITFMMLEHAVKAFTELDGTIFQGRMLHILPGQEKVDHNEKESGPESFKKKREKEKKAKAMSSHNWNTLFLGANAVADVMAEKYGKAKSDILTSDGKQSLGVRMALGETQVVAETRQFLIENGVQLDAFSQIASARSKTVILVKNLPAGTKHESIRDLFSKHGELGRVLIPPSGVTAIVEFLEPTEAKTAFRRLAYTKFEHVPLYLEWAPIEVFKTASNTTDENMDSKTTDSVENTKTTEDSEKTMDDEEDSEIEPDSTVFVKGLNFDTTDETLKEAFSQCGRIHSASVAKKKDMKNPGQFLSMGYGFVTFTRKDDAQKALKELQRTKIDDFTVELKLSQRATGVVESHRKKQKIKKQVSTKILVRNVPFEAKENEIRELFKVFGELKSVRLPTKLSGTGSHRGFGFVDYLTKQDAKRAFEALCHSTHLFGRRLVLEWAESEDSVDQIRKRTTDHYHEGEPVKKLKKSNLLSGLKSGSGSVD